MPIVGTAGHVDHGKSTLVTALTGRDPDRWAEEKERGLTIDLGFAWADLGDGQEVGFVDVPGHERFIKNMLAGVGGVDVALLVVAADEGWMPQTEEHTAILCLLEVALGVIAITRSDLVDADAIELVRLEVADRVAGTMLETWPVVTVSAVTGAGIDELRAALRSRLGAAGPARDLGRPRMWIDRSFVIVGAGVVVTGTLVDGTLTRESPIMLYPSRREVKVRGLQSHERATEAAEPGQRTAVNLTGIDRDDAPRGTMLGPPGAFVVTRRLLATVVPVRSLVDPLTDRGAYQLHFGTTTVPARVRLIDEGAALLGLRSDVAATMGDRFILRETGRRAVVAGGRFLDPSPGERPTAADVVSLRAAIEGTADDRAAALLAVHGELATSHLAAASGGGEAAGLTAAGRAVTVGRAVGYREQAAAATRRFQEANPMRPGIPRQTLASAIGVEAELLSALLAGAVDLVEEGAYVRTIDFTSTIEDEAWEPARSTLAASLAVPRASQIGLADESLHARIRSGDLVRVGADLVYLPEQLEAVIAALDDLPEPFTVADFRDHLGLTRRQAVPLLEWLDGRGLTRRRGDVRSVRRKPSG